MTVNTTNITSGPYTGTGTSDTFSYTFRVTDKTQLSVFETTAAGVRTELTVDTDYTVAGVGDDAGGTLTRVAGNLPTDYTWFIRSNYQSTQDTAFTSQGAFFPDVHENSFDKLTFLLQQIEDALGRAVRLSTDLDNDGSFVIDKDASDRSATVLGFDANGDVVLLDRTDVTIISVVMAQSRTLASGQTSVTFTNSVENASFYITGLDADNGRLQAGTDYTLTVATNTVKLTQSYPEGTVLTLAYNDVGSNDKFDLVQTFDTVADLQAASLAAGLLVRTKGDTAAGDGGYGTWFIVSGDSSSSNHRLLLANGNTAVFQEGVLLNGTTVSVPTDYATLQEAVDAARYWRVGDGQVVAVLMETGFSPASGISVSNGDYSHIQISSVDSEVALDASFPVTHFIYGTACRLPTLNCMVNANGKGSYGYAALSNTFGTITAGSGVKNTVGRGLYLNAGSQVLASGCIFTGAGSIATDGLSRGAWIARGSTLIAESSNFSDAADTGVYVSRASTVHAMDLTAQNCGKHAVWCHRASRLTAHAVFAPGVRLSTASAFPVVLATRGSTVAINADAGSAPVTITQEGTGDGVSCTTSLVEINSADLVGGASSNDGAIVTGGGVINHTNGTVSGFNINIVVNNGEYSGPGVSATAARTFGVSAKRGRCNVAIGSITGSGTLDISNSKGAFTNADGCSTTSSVGTPAVADTNVPTLGAFSNLGAIFI
jgi:hypothetical protein